MWKLRWTNVASGTVAVLNITNWLLEHSDSFDISLLSMLRLVDGVSFWLIACVGLVLGHGIIILALNRFG